MTHRVPAACPFQAHECAELLGRREDVCRHTEGVLGDAVCHGGAHDACVQASRLPISVGADTDDGVGGASRWVHHPACYPMWMIGVRKASHQMVVGCDGNAMDAAQEDPPNERGLGGTCDDLRGREAEDRKLRPLSHAREIREVLGPRNVEAEQSTVGQAHVQVIPLPVVRDTEPPGVLVQGHGIRVDDVHQPHHRVSCPHTEVASASAPHLQDVGTHNGREELHPSAAHGPREQKSGKQRTLRLQERARAVSFCFGPRNGPSVSRVIPLAARSMPPTKQFGVLPRSRTCMVGK